MEELPRIGIFDSGIGGFSVLAACMQRVRGVYYYYGDNVRAPYGSRSKEEITSFVREALRTFEQVGVDAAVLACNTATAVCAEEMRSEFSFPIVGVEPAVKRAAAVCKSAIVLATPRTAESERLRRLIARLPECRFTVFAAKGLAGAIEAHFLKGETLHLERHLPPTDCEGVVLGCTHYSLIKDEISCFMGKPTFDGTVGTAVRLENVIKVGIDIHLNPLTDFGDCLTEKSNKNHKNRIIFLGSGKKANKRFYNTNECFRFS